MRRFVSTSSSSLFGNGVPSEIPTSLVFCALVFLYIYFPRISSLERDTSTTLNQINRVFGMRCTRLLRITLSQNRLGISFNKAHHAETTRTTDIPSWNADDWAPFLGETLRGIRNHERVQYRGKRNSLVRKLNDILKSSNHTMRLRAGIENIR